MIQKKVKFSGNKANVHQEEEETASSSSSTKSRRFKEKHSLDSDEELDDEEGTSKDENILNEDDIEGQEDETIRNDEGIQVTPFNLKDELEEGHFDAYGTYIANRDEATDQWLESEDWNKVENQFQSKKKKKVTTQVEEEEKEDIPQRSKLQTFQEMITLMKPGENILKALRRLGGNKKPMSSADRWKKKKQQQQSGEEKVDPKVEEDKANLLKLTGLADDLLQQGDYQIYEKTYEKIKFEIEKDLSQFEDADVAVSNVDDDIDDIPNKKQKLNKDEEDNERNDEVMSEDDELEAAFAESEGKQSKVKKSGKEKLRDKPPNVPIETSKNIGGDTTSSVSFSDEVCWVYKLNESDESSEQLGPFTSTDMMKKQEDGLFGDGVFCRKVGSEGSFYSSNRIDFELYT